MQQQQRESYNGNGNAIGLVETRGLFDMADERLLARGGVERIGSQESRCFVEIAGQRRELTTSVPDHAVAVRQCLQQLTDREFGCLEDAGEVSAIGFKTVHGGRTT